MPNLFFEKDKKQIKSKERVAAHGEVFTAEREVKAMLDLVKQETERIESRFLEPACGNGNFLAEILRRKLNVVEAHYASCQVNYELYALIAVGSIYGIDILQDNVDECRQRLYTIFFSRYMFLFPEERQNEAYLNSIRFLFKRNILWGDALTLQTPEEPPKAIIFSEWSALNGMIKRRDFMLDALMKNNRPIEEPNLFSDLGDEAFLPKPICEYPLVHYLKLSDNDSAQHI